MTDTATETARLAAQVNTPADQHAFLTIRTQDGAQDAVARWPVEAAGSAQEAYNAAEHRAGTHRINGLSSAYVLEVNPPADAPPFDQNPDPAAVLRAVRLGYTVELIGFSFRFLRPDGEADGEDFQCSTDAWIAAAGDAALWVLDHGEPEPRPVSDLMDVLARGLAYEAEAFDGDGEVNGADLVDWFANWRRDLRAAMEADGAAPDRGAVVLIRSMGALIEEAIDAHIYQDGDEVSEDCAYHAAIATADAYVAAFPLVDQFQPAPIGALEVIRDLEGSISELDQQIDQMSGMFPDDDGAIQQAQEEAAEALHRAKVYRETMKEDAA